MALIDLPTSTWTNWVGNQSFTPVVETDGLRLDLSAVRGVLDADPVRKRATAL